MFVPRLGLMKPRQNIGLSATMGLLNENDSLVYFSILGGLSSGLSFTVSFFKTSSFLSLSGGFFRGQGRRTSQHPYVLVVLGRPNIRKRDLLAFCTKFERHTLQRRLP